MHQPLTHQVSSRWTERVVCVFFNFHYFPWSSLKPAWGQLMAWCQTGDTTVPPSKMTKSWEKYSRYCADIYQCIFLSDNVVFLFIFRSRLLRLVESPISRRRFRLRLKRNRLQSITLTQFIQAYMSRGRKPVIRKLVGTLSFPRFP